MNIPPDDLNEWARMAFRINGQLLKIIAIANPMTTEHALQAQKQANLLIQQLQRAGADDPGLAIIAQERGTEVAVLFAPQETPLHLLSSPAAQRYAEAIRSAATACREMEKERGIEDGLSEVLEDYAADAELEVYGPYGMHE